MANPIFTFQDKQLKNPCFFILDTVSGLPKTVPMDLLTFLQYWGIDSKEKVSLLYSIYPQLLETGTSLKDSSFNSLPEYIQQLCFEYLKLDVDKPTEQEKEVIHQLENLFTEDLPFIEFYPAYKQLIEGINHAPKRPANFYLSWRRAWDILNCTDHRIQDIFSDLVQQNGISPKNLNCKLNNVYSCLEESLFSRFPKLMAACFLELAKRNLMAIDAIPHALRNDEAIQELFIMLGMEAYLPNEAIDYNLYDQSEPLCEEVDDIRYLRQFFNLYTFYADCKPLKGIDILSISKAELKDLLQENNCYNAQIVNFKDRNGNYLLPMMYASDYIVNPQKRFHFLAPFGYQSYHIVTKCGKVIEDTGYYDFYFLSENIAYVQNAGNLLWVRWFFNEETQDVDKQDIAIDNPYEEGVWEQEEERFQQSIIENQKSNQLDTYEILQLDLGTEDDMYSLYLTMLNTPTEEAIKNELKKALKRLLNRGVNISYRYVAAFELYKELLHSNGQISMFSTPRLNYFSLYDNLTDKLETGFKKNYQNEDFAREIYIENPQLRPVRSHFSLGLFQWRGHYTLSYQFHFKMHAAVEVFQQDCEDFINRNPFATEGDLEAYANEFLSYLLGRNYKQVNAYKQYVGKNSIQELIGVDLEPDSNLKYTVQHDNNINNIDDEDDLPF